MLVDDDDDARTGMRRLLRLCGCEVVEFAGAAPALAHLLEHGAQLLVTDLEMPGMDGAELIAALRARGVAIATAMVSGRGVATCEQRLAAVGVNDGVAILAKPVALADLRALAAQVAVAG